MPDGMMFPKEDAEYAFSEKESGITLDPADQEQYSLDVAFISEGENARKQVFTVEEFEALERDLPQAWDQYNIPADEVIKAGNYLESLAEKASPIIYNASELDDNSGPEFF